MTPLRLIALIVGNQKDIIIYQDMKVKYISLDVLKIAINALMHLYANNVIKSII
jgi:hypothetical protein